MSEKTTPVEAAAMAGGGAWAHGMQDAHVPHLWRHISAAVITAALDVKEGHYGTDMTVAMLEIHGAICEDSPEECLEYRGACVKAFEAAKTALLEGSDR